MEPLGTTFRWPSQLLEVGQSVKKGLKWERMTYLSVLIESNRDVTNSCKGYPHHSPTVSRFFESNGATNGMETSRGYQRPFGAICKIFLGVVLKIINFEVYLIKSVKRASHFLII